MIPASLFPDEFTLGLISQSRIWSAGKGFSKAGFFLAAAMQSERSDTPFTYFLLESQKQQMPTTLF
jgi:hypothetical protein